MSRRYLQILLLQTTLFVGCESKTSDVKQVNKSQAEHVINASPEQNADSRDCIQIDGKTMGTTYHMTACYAREQQLDNRRKAHASELKVRVDNRLKDINAIFSTYQPDSELSRINKKPKITATPSRELNDVFVVAQRLRLQTQGAFNHFGDALFRVWGFDRDKRTHVPSQTELSRIISQITVWSAKDRFELRVGDVVSEINLSAIAKGYGVDAISKMLEQEAESYLVEIGGETRVSGLNPKGVPWTLGINEPRASAEVTSIYGTVQPGRRAMATSGTYRNFFEHEGKRYAHIIDPRTGWPIPYGLVSVSILAEDCTLADGLATAAMVLGEEKTRALIKDHYPTVDALFIYDDSGTLRHSETSGFGIRL